MHSKTFILYSILVCLSCNDNNIHSANVKIADKAGNETNPYPSINEIPLPPGGFERIKRDGGSFASFLLSIHLKKDKTVYTFDGRIKANQTVQFAVLDISVGNRDLQQCADAVMRIRAE